MQEYIRKSLDKFGQDVLSKSIYDGLKYTIILLLALLVAIFIPKSTSIGTIVNQRINLSILNIVLIVIIAVAITLLITLLYSRKKYKVLEKDNHTDELTGLLNHKAFKDNLPKAIEVCRKQNIKLSLIIIDVDDFKNFNKKYNYQIADKVLAKVGLILKSDSRATDLTFRQYLKGDEFIIIAKETDLGNAVRAADRKRNLFKTGLDVDGASYWLTVSCGVTEYNFSTDTQDQVLSRLKNALDIAKSRPEKNATEALV